MMPLFTTTLSLQPPSDLDLDVRYHRALDDEIAELEPDQLQMPCSLTARALPDPRHPRRRRRARRARAGPQARRRRSATSAAAGASRGHGRHSARQRVAVVDGVTSATARVEACELFVERRSSARSEWGSGYIRQPGPMRAYYVRSRRGHQIAVVAVARKLAVLFWCLLTRHQHYAHQ
jgi:hypothetical protein